MNAPRAVSLTKETRKLQCRDMKNVKCVLLTALAFLAWVRPALCGDTPEAGSFGARVSAIELEAGGRIGIAAFDTATGASLGHRADERFAMCSTFKLLLVSAVLARADAGAESLDRLVAYGPDDLVQHSPVVAARLQEKSMSVHDLCAAALVYSDNAAANLLLGIIGGPAGVTSYARSLGDTMTRLDRTEPSLNSNHPGDLKDTTTPAAMLGSMRAVLVGGALSPGSRDLLVSWLTRSATGSGRLRAGIDPRWPVGSKSGSGGNGAANDIAIVWPPGRSPILIAVYYSESTSPESFRDEAIAEVGRIVIETLLNPALSNALR